LDGSEDGRRSCARLDGREEVSQLLRDRCLGTQDVGALCGALVDDSVECGRQRLRDVGHGGRLDEFRLEARNQGAVGCLDPNLEAVGADGTAILRCLRATVIAVKDAFHGVGA
jgi:hypothetical protein